VNATGSIFGKGDVGPQAWFGTKLGTKRAVTDAPSK
jgi:hypothetical protein